MEVSVENTGGLERRLAVQVPAERVEEELRSRLQAMSKTVRVDGFRPGKVPLNVIEQKFGEQIRHEVVSQLVNTTLQEAINQNGLHPAGAPSVEQNPSRAGEPLSYVATFEVFPDFADGVNCNFTIEKPVVDITEQDVDAMLENLRSQRATWQQVDRASRSGDQVTIDFSGTIDGKPFGGGQADDVSLVLGSGKMIPGFEQQLEGVSAGEEKNLQVSFPDNYPAAELAGKAAVFAVKVRAVSESVLPELDDEFADSFGVGGRGVAGLREDVEANMQRELKSMLVATLKDQAFRGLLANNHVEVPRVLVRKEAADLNKQQGGQGEPDEKVIAKAEKRLKLGMLMSELARRNQIQVDSERVRHNLETIAASYENPDEVLKWYYSNQDMMAGVQTAVMEEQVVEWMMEHAGASVNDRKMSFSELVDEAKKAQV